MLQQVAESWHAEIQALREGLEVVQTAAGNGRPERAIRFQMERMREEYLLRELAARSFLSGYGFPTDVVSLVTTTMEEVNRQREAREDNRAARNGYPARGLPIAIRDYAPGTDTVLDGRVYRSGGVTLNWHIPASQDGPSEVQSLRWMWRCRVCGSNGTRPTRPESCPNCDSGRQPTCYEYLQPAGFAVDIRSRPHNDITIPQYIPVREPLISLEGADWLSMPSPGHGRYRVSDFGSLFHRTDGLRGKGYALCLRCGRAESMPSDERLPAVFADEQGNPIPHKRLRGGRNNDREIACPGSNEPWAIKRGLRLGAATHTEVLEMQLHDPINGRPVDRSTAYSLAVALRRALTQRLGIEEQEVGCAAAPSRGERGDETYSVYLFDTASGGAGYVSQAINWFPELFRQAREVLTCSRNCDAACQACLLTYDTQYQVDNLDRIQALDLLSDTFLDALELPEELQAFGAETWLEMEPLVLALRRELQRHPIHEIRVFLDGRPEAWEPLDWRLRDELLRLKDAKVRLSLIMARRTWQELEGSQKDELAAFAAMIGAEVYLSEETTRTAEEGRDALHLALEMGNDRYATRWAASEVDALAPTSRWGSGEGGVRFVRGHLNYPLPPPRDNWLRMAVEQLRDVPEAALSIAFTRELNGPSRQFGRQAWQRLFEKCPRLRDRLKGDQPLSAIQYSDRYLRSPLTLLLMRELLGELANYRGGLIADHTCLSLTTSHLPRRDTYEQPCWLHHDWRDATDRRQVFERLFDGLGQFTLDVSSQTRMPHARELQLIWPDDTVWTLRLDQGVGYWRVRNSREPFPFEQSVDRQLERLKSCEIDIEAGYPAHPTYWYVEGP